MLYELHQEDLSKIETLLIGERVNLEIKAIAAKNNPGWIFVDDHNNPKTALVYSHGQKGFYFVGQPNNCTFETALLQTMIDLQPRLAGLNVDYFEYSGTSLDWENYLERLFANKNYNQFTQHVYLMPEIQMPARQEGRGDKVVKVTGKFLDSPTINSLFVKNILKNWWDSTDKFLEKGSGYAVVCEGKTVSICCTCFVAGDKDWALGVYTHPEYQKRGYAKEAAIAVLEESRKNGVRFYWDCMESNTPSRKLAVSLGFTLAFTYQVYNYEL